MIEGLFQPNHFPLLLLAFAPYAIALFVTWKFYSLLRRLVISAENIAETLCERNKLQSQRLPSEGTPAD